MSRKYRKNYNGYKYSRRLSNQEQLILGISILAVLIYFFVIKPAIDYVSTHKTFFIIIGAIISLGVLAFGVIIIMSRLKKKEQIEKFEKEQIERGLIKFVDRFGNIRWGKPEEVKEWTIEDERAKEKEKVINQVVSEIENFRPLKDYYNEYLYQQTLGQHLLAKFPTAGVILEKQKGSSRPDIVVGDVAIEIKGPTRHKELRTISDKCARYKLHFGEVIIVLFNVEVIDRLYNEWKKSIEENFPKVKIIRK